MRTLHDPFHDHLLTHCPPEAPLRGIVHGAGLLDDGVVASQSAERLAGVMWPKADDAANLAPTDLLAWVEREFMNNQRSGYDIE